MLEALQEKRCSLDQMTFLKDMFSWKRGMVSAEFVKSWMQKKRDCIRRLPVMIKLAGCVMIIAGCAGVANAWCAEQKRRLVMLKQIRKIYEDMKYYISYQRTTIPEALHRIAENKELFLTDVFDEIYEEQKKGEKNFPENWEKHMRRALAQTPLQGRERGLLLEFPSCLGFMKGEAQAGALDELLREVSRQIEEREEEQKSKNKMVMSLGLAGGILLTILLL